MTVAVLLCLVLFAAVFTFVQAIVMIALHTSQQEEAAGGRTGKRQSLGKRWGIQERDCEKGKGGH
ncbi:MAG: hypothetical protein K6E64_08780 [Lachnospiraceae bacterium]|nr:hypothetical protein [Lachnospiraceae bacterium]